MDRLTEKKATNVPDFILKKLGIEDVSKECYEIKGTNSETCKETCEGHNCNDCPIAQAIDKLAEYEDLEEQGRLVKLNCKVGDTVYLRAACECVITSFDSETGVYECPFENACDCEECNNGVERLFKTSITGIWTDGRTWQFSVKGLDLEIPISDIGERVFLTLEQAAEKWRDI